jgi:hypothetical protein
MGNNWAMYGQHGLKVTSKSCEDSQILSNFHEIWSEELHYEKQPNFFLTLMFESYNSIDSMEWGAKTVWGWCPTNQLQDPIVSSLNP